MSLSQDGAHVLPESVLVVGFARTGAAVARVLSARGVTVVAVDDAPSVIARADAANLGIELFETPTGDALDELVAHAGLVVASPGVPPSHPVLRRAPASLLVSEVELAARLGGPPIVAITGTNGKTTVTSLVASMLARSGRKVRAAGNIGFPLIEAVTDPGLELVVAEVSSFQLALTTTFRPKVGAWLNLAEDHLDWHRDLDDYRGAKARIWARQGPEDVMVANADDGAVMAEAKRFAGRLVTFGIGSGDFRLDGERLVGPDGEVWAHLGDLTRAMPHDVANALAALAVASVAGGDVAGCVTALREQDPLPHRVEPAGSLRGVEYYDDSKATTPSAVVAALAGFHSVVLVAGGRNKGLDLGAIATAVRSSDRAAGVKHGSKLRGVVAVGEAADEVEAAFAPSWPVVRAGSMDAAVAEAARLAEPGDVVLLSPGCASFDWYSSYEERGADFVRAVRALGAVTSGSA
ncbi:MAG: UDP-N-acetylmuramoylalanine--D-glutamate ligase [Acidimicrobiaceae bacterium]|nr:UDP-N-acetylmuramoylalanine--D-glutamate ligase [Acidimicrobiaceae bacterium]